MKKLFVSLLVISVAASCAKKATPAASTSSTQPAPVASTTTTTTTTTTSAGTTSTATTTGSTDMVAAGQSTFEAKCGRCHGLKDPSNYTVKQWGPILDNMALKAKLEAAEKANVLAYVSSKAKS